MKRTRKARKSILNIGLVILLLLSPVFAYDAMSIIKVTTSCGKVVSLLVGSEDQTMDETMYDLKTLEKEYCGGSN